MSWRTAYSQLTLPETPVLGRLCWDACAGTPVSEPQHRLPTSDAGPETGSLFPKADGHSESLAFDDTA